MILKVFLRRKILGDILVEYLGDTSGKNQRGIIGKYLGSISRKNLRGITREIFVGYFEEDFGENIDHYILFVDINSQNKHFEMKFEYHFEFRASLRKFQDLNFWDATAACLSSPLPNGTPVLFGALCPSSLIRCQGSFPCTPILRGLRMSGHKKIAPATNISCSKCYICYVPRPTCRGSALLYMPP
jgi:hypothetical protein